MEPSVAVGNKLVLSVQEHYFMISNLFVEKINDIFSSVIKKYDVHLLFCSIYFKQN